MCCLVVKPVALLSKNESSFGLNLPHGKNNTFEITTLIAVPTHINLKHWLSASFSI